MEEVELKEYYDAELHALWFEQTAWMGPGRCWYMMLNCIDGVLTEYL